MVALGALEKNLHGFVIGLMHWRLGFVRESTEGVEASQLLGVGSTVVRSELLPHRSIAIKPLCSKVESRVISSRRW